MDVVQSRLANTPSVNASDRFVGGADNIFHILGRDGYIFHEGRWGLGLTYAGLSLVGCLLMTALGWCTLTAFRA